MITRNISYTDFNGVQRTEQFYFHLSVPEVTKIVSKGGSAGIESYMQYLIEQDDMEKIIEFITEVILTAYGEISVDGKTFIKTPEVRRKFEYSQAYAELFEQLFTDASELENFIAGLTKQGGVKDRFRVLRQQKDEAKAGLPSGSPRE